MFDTYFMAPVQDILSHVIDDKVMCYSAYKKVATSKCAWQYVSMNDAVLIHDICKKVTNAWKY